MNKGFTLPPHPVLEDYYACESGRRIQVRGLFDASAPYYDNINRVMSFGTGENYRRHALLRAGLKQGDKTLDVGCGTGVLASYQQDIVGTEGVVIGLDPSPGMLAEAKQRGVRNTLLARGEHLPLKDNAVDFLSMGYALRHVEDLAVAFDEYLRVLRPGGTVLLLEISPPTSRIGFHAVKLYMKHVIPLVTRLVTRNKAAHTLMSYYWDTIEQCVAPHLILDALRATGFVDVKRRVIGGVFCEYTARRPTDSQTTTTIKNGK